MKKTNRILLAALGLSAALFTQSCEKEPQKNNSVLTPNFPETVVEKTIVKGQEKTDFKIQPNQAWKVEVLGEGAGTIFWIDDEGMKETSISGKEAGEVAFSVTFDSKEEFDNNRLCEVKLTMGNRSRIIGKLTRAAKNRTLTLEVAKIDAETESFKEEYERTDVAELVTFSGVCDYSRPVRILANYSWSLAIPDFCEAYVDGKLVDGAISCEQPNTAVVVVLRAKIAKEIVNGAEGVLKVIDSSNPNEYSEGKVRFPNISARLELEPATHTEFNDKGQLSMVLGYQDQPAIAYVLSTEDVVFKALPFDGTAYGAAFADWVKMESGWNAAGAPLQKYNLSMSVLPYDGEGERHADVLALPKSMDSEQIKDFLNAEGTALKKEYEAYVLNRLTQTGKPVDYLTPVYPDEMAGAMISFGVYPDDAWIANTVAAKQVFTITYGETWSGDAQEGTLKLNKAYDHIKVYDADVNEISEADFKNEQFWVSMMGPFGPDGNQIKVMMDPSKCKTDLKEAFIAFYTTPDAQKAEAILYCKFSADAPVNPGSDLIAISTGKGSVKKLSEADEWYWTLSGEFSTTENYEVTTADRTLALKFAKEYWNILLFKSVPPFEALTDGTFSTDAMGDVYVYAGESVTAKSDCILVFKDENGLNIAAVHYIFDPQGAISGAAPFTFAYPGMVQNAKLASYTGDMGIFNQFGPIDRNIIMQLTYTGPEQMTLLNVPGLPAGEAPYSESPWLTYELQAENQIMISMANTPLDEIGYYAWLDQDGMPTAILVCTRTAKGWE